MLLVHGPLYHSSGLQSCLPSASSGIQNKSQTKDEFFNVFKLMDISCANT